MTNNYKAHITWFTIRIQFLRMDVIGTFILQANDKVYYRIGTLRVGTLIIWK